MQRSEILNWLRESDPARLEELWRRADAARRACVGDAVYLRALIELSNRCRRNCHYCGLRASNRGLPRYRMERGEVVAIARQAAALGLGTVVLQSGEDEGRSPQEIAALVADIRSAAGVAVTLSLGERSDADLRLWREAGADRYLLRFETSNRSLFERIHPVLPGRSRDRFEQLASLRELGYEVGSGIMIGIPGQSLDDLADDVEHFARLDLDMIGVGPFIPHPATPMGANGESRIANGESGTTANGDLRRAYGETGVAANGHLPFTQSPADELTTLKVIALARLACPHANIPATTALATINPKDGRERALRCGANIVMPIFTAAEHRADYEIYPGKACVHETAERCHGCLRRRIESLGRTLGTGRGDSPNWTRRTRGQSHDEGNARCNSRFAGCPS